MQTSECGKSAAGGGCGAKIVWATIVDAQGRPEYNKQNRVKKIPLDPKPAVYFVTETPDGVVAVRAPAAMVTHFAVCRDANRFSGSNRNKVDGTDKSDTLTE